MKEQITVPRATWDALREALEEACGNRCNAEYNPCYAREALTAANAVTSEYSEQPQAQGDSYSERWYGSGEDRGWWIVRGGLVKREHVAFLGESVVQEEVTKVVAELNATHPQATEPAGYKLVPVELTPEMCDAARWSEYGEETSRQYEVSNEFIQSVWTSLLTAAPEAKQ